MADYVLVSGELVKESALAYCLRDADGNEEWFPKSEITQVTTYIGDIELEVPGWLAIEKGFD